MKSKFLNHMGFTLIEIMIASTLMLGVGFDAYGNPNCGIDPKAAEIAALQASLAAL